MKRTVLFMACLLASLAMSAQDGLTVGDIQNSGCLAMTRGEEPQSNESFTAQFDTQKTSISLTPALSHREGAIYNLQGQRISSLRKGLNIVNGRKVFVKE